MLIARDRPESHTQILFEHHAKSFKLIKFTSEERNNISLLDYPLDIPSIKASILARLPNSLVPKPQCLQLRPIKYVTSVKDPHWLSHPLSNTSPVETLRLRCFRTEIVCTGPLLGGLVDVEKVSAVSFRRAGHLDW